MKLIFTKLIRLLSLEQFYHQPMGVYGGGFLKGICYGSDPVVISLQLTNIQGLIGLNKYGQHLLRQTINVFHYKLGGAPLSRNTQSNYHTVTMCCLEELLR